MYPYASDRFLEWMTVQPTVGILMVVTALVLFGASFHMKEAAPSFWQWIREIVEASVGALLFLGLLWAFRAILNANNATFSSTHGSSNETTLESAQSIWGRPHIQRGLSVDNYVETVEQEELPRPDPAQPPVYRSKKVQTRVDQNSILGFVGQVNMTLSEREKGYALYSGFVVNAQFEYDVINDWNSATLAVFTFPLSPKQTLQ
jgi:hypothetical protein